MEVVYGGRDDEGGSREGDREGWGGRRESKKRLVGAKSTRVKHQAKPSQATCLTRVSPNSTSSSTKSKSSPIFTHTCLSTEFPLIDLPLLLQKP
ncbi:hypothetical protein L6452_31951 [Arctium lappa]|uniref:Uncharacterized protein n=1 Tax=Arctium lappa TaxID=4217 RepID=A0ACB8Z3K9_ARCLA|nr:hypothetical protein L6452_31951 [Arctium lappa]